MTNQDYFELALAAITALAVIGWWQFRRFITRIDKFTARVDRVERVLWKVVHRQDAIIRVNGGRVPLDDDDISEDELS